MSEDSSAIYVKAYLKCFGGSWSDVAASIGNISAREKEDLIKICSHFDRFLFDLGKCVLNNTMSQSEASDSIAMAYPFLDSSDLQRAVRQGTYMAAK